MDENHVSDSADDADEGSGSLFSRDASGALDSSGAGEQEPDQPQSAASSPIGPAAVPESPPDTPTGNTPPESPPGAPESPPQSPPALQSTPLVQETLNLSIDNELDFEAEAPETGEPGGVAGEPREEPEAPVLEPGEADPEDQKETGEITEATNTTSSSRRRRRTRGDDSDSLEEGEISDDEDKNLRNEIKSVCRFFNKGQCTWGISCRFIHPGVTDKGNYNMFAPAAPPRPVKEEELADGPAGSTKEQEKEKEQSARPEPIELRPGPGFETAWERAVREGKERLRKASKRRETDIDFEEKKMNLSLAQAELDRENHLYARSASPTIKDEPYRRRG